jgi:hypothetical protein
MLGTILDSTTTAYQDFGDSLSRLASTAGTSSLYTFQNLTLTGNTFVGTMDMSLYRNFNIDVYGIRDGSSNYRIAYTADDIGSLDYNRGIITINISTSGSTYTNNNGQLRFDAYRWGLPTTVWGNVYPYIADAEYTIQYEYTILSRTLYTNLLNVYPKIEIRNATVSPYVTNVFVGVNGLTDVFWRGTPVKISWTNYSFFPYLQLGAPPFNPEVGISIIVNNVVVAEHGPFLMYTSSAIVNAPYLLATPSISPIVSTFARVFILGKPDSYTTAGFNTIVPKFNVISMNAPNAPGTATGYIAGTELVAITDAITYPLYGATALQTVSPYTGNQSYSVNNLTNGILNRVGDTGRAARSLTCGSTSNASVSGFFENSLTYPDFYVNLNNYFEEISTLRNFNSQFTFTFINAVSSYTFTPNVISSIGPGSLVYRLQNSNISKTFNTFATGDLANLTYTYSPVKYISSCGRYSESVFIGPVGPAADQFSPGNTRIDWSITTGTTLISTLTFYNLLNNNATGIVQANTTANQPISVNVNYNSINYYSTFVTNGSEAAQVFRF